MALWLTARNDADAVTVSGNGAVIDFDKVIAAEVVQLPSSIDYGIKVWFDETNYRYLFPGYSTDSDAADALLKLSRAQAWS